MRLRFPDGGALPSPARPAGAVAGRNSIGDEGARALAGALPSLPGLQELRLGGNRGRDPVPGSIRLRFAAIRFQELRLGNNRIGDEGARALAGALPSLPGLQELRLGGNRGRDPVPGSIRLRFAAIRFQELWLGSNSIGDEGARALAGALPSLPSLQKLRLRGNYIGDEGARALAGALPSLPGLQELRLGGNRGRQAKEKEVEWEEVDSELSGPGRSRAGPVAREGGPGGWPERVCQGG
ncbi:unnamed protein product [Prorocentrum cordatum]|uniref:Uncharacterized protein n=1 Tax=Prorocentrum cordatum TaxID=2364126 RepID=A0ABN9Q4K1_9DINO|nr:unnamed protein product [Polarella glacialis]